MLILRDYQKQCVAQMDVAKSAVLLAATGSGKTVMAAATAWKEVNRGGYVSFVVPRDNLAKQTARSFRRWGLNAGFVLGGHKENRSAKVQILSYQSLGSKKRSLDWIQDRTSLWLTDEAHITSFAKALEDPLTCARRKIALTATPWQMGAKRSLLDIFDEVIFAPPPKELIGRGYLAQPVYFCPRKKGKLDAEPDFIYAQWERYAYNEKTFVFCGSIAESDATAAEFVKGGVPAKSVTSKTPKKETESIFEDFASGKVLILVSPKKLAEGCDEPTATCVILASRTDSMSAYYQRKGRGARICEGKTYFKVIDCVGLSKKFPRFEEYEPSLADFEKQDPKEGGVVPQKQCEKCLAWSHLSAKLCSNPECRHSFDIQSEYQNPGELERITKDDREARAIAHFHTLLVEEFRAGNFTGRGIGCEDKFKDTYGYFPLSHWVSDAVLPASMQSAVVESAWQYHKKKVSDRLPTEPVQLSLQLP